MTKKLVLVALSFLILEFLVLPIPTWGEAKPLLGSLLEHGQKIVRGWEMQFTVVVILTAAVGIFGVVTGILQGLSQSWCKAATILIGAVISIITVVNNTFFLGDHRTLRQHIALGNSILTKMEVFLDDFNRASPENRPVIRIELLGLYDRLLTVDGDLGKRLSGIDEKGGASGIVIATAHAQQRLPDWVSKVPEEPSSMFFVGVGEDPSFDAAKEASLRNAREQAIRTVLQKARVTWQSQVETLEELRVREFVNKLGDIADTGFVVDKQAGYKYWTLLRLNRRFLDRAVLGVQEPSSPAGLKVLQSERPQYFSSDRRVRVEYANITVDEDKRATLSFQATAMVKARFPGRAAPWVHVQLVDAKGGPIGGFVQVVESSVDDCGGSKNHKVALGSGFPTSAFVMAASFRIQMGGSDPQKC